MSLPPRIEYCVPEETARVAWEIFPNGNLYMQWYETFGTLFEDQDFAALFSAEGQPALSPMRLCLVLLLQFAEGLSDRQAAEAVRTRIDWKYLLCLELTDTGFHYSVLSEFRGRLVTNGAEAQIFNRVLELCRAKGLIKKRGLQRSDSTEVLAAIRTLNRLELVGETLRAALNALAVAAPEWTRKHTTPEWVDRYGPQVSDYHLPTKETEREAHAGVVGVDGLTLLTALWQDQTLPWLRELPAVQVLWQVWLQNYTWAETGQLRWRTATEVPPAAQAICSPYDLDARFSQKRSTAWIGYKVHLTETCAPDLPRLITNVETSVATTQDDKLTTPIHHALQDKDCLPDVHIVDCGYMSAEELVASQHDYGVDLLGPTRPDTSWQASEGQGFSLDNFVIDWESQQATCPAGQTSRHWYPALNRHGQPIIYIKFSKQGCRACPVQTHCTRANPPRRTITVRPEALHEALLKAREREKTDDFAEQYARRAGIEGTISQGVRAFDIRHARYLGLTKTHLQQVLTATVMNIIRALHWLAGDRPTQTRSSVFAKLHAVAA
jgi:transposase